MQSLQQKASLVNKLKRAGWGGTNQSVGLGLKSASSLVRANPVSPRLVNAANLNAITDQLPTLKSLHAGVQDTL